MVFTRVAGQSDFDTEFGNAPSNAYVATKIVPSSSLSVDTIRVNRTVAQTQPALVGIASSIGAATTNIVYISKNDASDLNGVGWRTVFLPQRITLNSGTTYYLVIASLSGGDAYRLGCSGSAGAAYTAIGSVDQVTALGGSAWGAATSTYVVAFDLGTDTANPLGAVVSSKSITDAILATKRAAQGASSDKLAIDDVNYKDRQPQGPDSGHKTINDLWYARWGNLGEKTSIQDRMYKFFGGTTATMGQHKSVSDLLAEWFHAAGRP